MMSFLQHPLVSHKAFDLPPSIGIGSPFGAPKMNRTSLIALEIL